MITPFKIFLRKLFDKIVFFESFAYRNKGNKNSVLIIRIDALGDYILFSHTLAEYKKIFPKNKISILTIDQNLDIAKGIGHIDRHLSFNKKSFRTNMLYRRNVLLGITKGNYDTVVYPAFSREPIGDLFVKFSHARRRIGIKGDLCNINATDFSHNNKLYTKLIELSPYITSEVKRNTTFINSIRGHLDDDSLPEISIPESSFELANKLLNKSGLEEKKYVVLFPGAGSTSRIWPLERYADICSFLISNDITPVICGSASEGVLAKKIKDISHLDLIDFTGKTDIMCLAAILKRSKFYLGSETGILHLACAVGTPTICLLGGGHFGRFYPYGDLNRNRPVYDKNMKCKNDDWACARKLKNGEAAPCINAIAVDSVKMEIADLLKNNPQSYAYINSYPNI